MRRFAALAAGTLLAAACTAPASTPSPAPEAPPQAPAQVQDEGYWGGRIILQTEATAASAALTAPPERVWPALSEAYGDLGISVTEADEAARILGNPRISVRRRLGGEQLSTFLSCGLSRVGAPIADTYSIRLSLRSSVVAEGTGSRVVTTAEASARNPDGTNAQPVACTVNGRLGELILSRVRMRLASGA